LFLNVPYSSLRDWRLRRRAALALTPATQLALSHISTLLLAVLVFEVFGNLQEEVAGLVVDLDTKFDIDQEEANGLRE
jgi:hypothetical protein